MAPSNSRKAWIAWLDRAALAGLVGGIGLYLLPAAGALRWGFWITLFFTVFHIATSHARSSE